MIRLVGTSHISPQSIEKIIEEIEKGADCVAVELDEGRYRSLKSGERGSYPSLFFKVVAWLQRKLAEKTGVLPGQEMLTATEKAMENGIEVYLMDRPIYETLRKFQDIGILEKVKLVLFSLFKVGRYDFSLEEVPPQELVQESIEFLSKRSPSLYRVLVEERDAVMAEALHKLSQRHEDVIAVVGAGHLPGIKDRLEEKGVEYVDKTFK